MVHGARRESLGGWNEISYRGIFGSISNSRKRNSKAREAAERPGNPPSPGRPHGRPGRDVGASHPRVTFGRHTSGRPDDRTSCRACITVPLGSYLHMDLTGEVTAGGRHFCSTFVHRGATSPTWSNLIRTCANNQCAPPSTRQPFCVCVQRARMPSRRHLRPAGGRFFSVSRADRESTRESPRDRSE